MANYSGSLSILYLDAGFVEKAIALGRSFGNVMVNNSTAWLTGVEPDKEKITFTCNTPGKSFTIHPSL